MRKPKDVEDMASRLTAAAQRPLVPPPQEAVVTPLEPRRRGRPPLHALGGSAAPITLRLPLVKYEQLEAEAIAETKATGKGVSIQQIILRKLGAAE